MAWQGKIMMANRLVNYDCWNVKGLVDTLSMAGCINCSVDPVLGKLYRGRLLHESFPPHFYATLWFDPVPDLD